MMPFFKGFSKGAKAFADIISFIINSILLIFVYFFGVGLTYVLSRLMKKQFLSMKANKLTYWEPIKENKEGHHRQF